VPSKLEILKTFFRGRSDCYVVWVERRKRYERIPQPLTDETIEKHLRGEAALCVYPIDEEGRCRFGMYDFDSKSAVAKERLIVLKRAAEHYSVPALIEPSGRRGIHLWLLFSSVPSEKVYRIMRLFVGEAAQSLDLTQEEFLALEEEPRKTVEIFPKQPKLSENVRYGNAAKLPWGRHPETGKRTAFCDESGTVVPDQEGMFDRIIPATEELVDWILQESPEEKQVESAATPTKLPLPCFNNFLLSGCWENTNRNNALLRSGIHLKQQGYDGQAIRQKIYHMNRSLTNGAPLGEAEVEDILKSVLERKGGEGYKSLGCDDPLWRDYYCGDADRQCCPVWLKEHSVVKVVRWIKTQPRQYVLEYRGRELPAVKSDVVLSIRRIRKVIFEEFGELPVLPAQSVWEDLVRQQMQVVEQDEPGEFGDSAYRVRSLISRVLNDAPDAETVEELAEGRVIRGGEYVYFKPHAVAEVLRRRFGVSVSLSDLWVHFASMEGRRTRIDLNGRDTKVCRVPVCALETP